MLLLIDAKTEKGGIIIKKNLLVVITTLLLTMPLAATAGDLEPPADPDNATSAMYTLEDIYNYLDTGNKGTKRTTGFTEPTAAPGATGRTLNEIHDKIEKTCFETCNGMLSSGGRWCDQGDGTIKDMTTTLVWLKDVSCDQLNGWWRSVIQTISYLENGKCGLTDGSVQDDWRMPFLSEYTELHSGIEPISYNDFQLFSVTGEPDFWTASMIRDIITWTSFMVSDGPFVMIIRNDPNEGWVPFWTDTSRDTTYKRSFAVKIRRDR